MQEKLTGLAAGHRKLAYRPDIDGLRAVAVLPVILFHADVPIFKNGFVGVDIFFVISGFLITSLISEEILSGTFSIVRFYERRIRRIFPVLFVVLGFCVLATAVLFLPTDLVQFSRSLAGAALFFSNVVFWKQTDYFDPGADTKPLLHTWSLAVEEQFYIFFPLFLVLIFRFGRGRWLAWLIPICLASLALSLWNAGPEHASTFYLAPTRAWELLLGALVALSPPVKLDGTAREVLAFTGIALVGVSILGVMTDAFHPANYYLPLNVAAACGGTALLIFAGGGTATARALGTSPFVPIGLISYSLYLWHWPLIALSEYVVVRPLTGPEIGLILLATLILAVISYRLVERPFRKRQLAPERRRLFAGAALAIVSAVLLAVASEYGDGWPQRFPSDLLARTTPEYQATVLQNPERDDCLTLPLTGPNAKQIEQGKVCHIGTGTPSFVLWGDSHGEAILRAVNLAAEHRNLAGYEAVISGCAPVIGFRRYDQNTDFCQASNEAVLKLIEQRHIGLVILAARWTVYWNGTYPPDEPPGLQVPLSPDGIANNASLMGEWLEETVAKLEGRGIKIVLMEPIPEPAMQVPRTLIMRSRFGTELPMGASLATYNRRNATLLPFFEQLPRKHANVTLVRPKELLCYGAFCPIAKNGRPLYYDDDHPSRFGAELIAPLFVAAFAGGRLDVATH